MGVSASVAVSSAALPTSTSAAVRIAARQLPGSTSVSDELLLLEEFWSPESSILNTICYCQVQSANENLPYLMHDFLIVKLQNQNALYIQAEKVNSGDNTGIRIFRVDDFPACEILQAIDVHRTLGLTEILDILADHDPAYNVFTNNCWKYALGTATRILLKVCENLEPDSGELKRIKKELSDLDVLVRANHYKGEGAVANFAAKALGFKDEYAEKIQDIVTKFCGPQHGDQADNSAENAAAHANPLSQGAHANPLSQGAPTW